MRKIPHYGWSPDLPDPRDFLLEPKPVELPKSVDLRPKCPPVYDQMELGSCTANAIAAAIEFDRMNAGQPAVNPSRLFIYYNERVIEHDPKVDGGAQIRDGVKSCAQKGVCPETTWPYDTHRFAVKPPAAAYHEAKSHLIKVYERVPHTAQGIKSCLAQGVPVIFGFSVFSAFESDEVAQTGIVQMPTRAESMVGGHAVLIVGYDDYEQMYLVRNSWGPTWGKDGYFWMAAAYVESHRLASDFWAINATD